MIILVTNSSRARECAAAIEQTTHQKTQVAASVAKAVKLLQTHDYDLLLVDESFHQSETRGVHLLLNHAGVAMPIYVNLGLHSTERVAREVQTGLLRVVGEKVAAMRSVVNMLRSELRGEVTGILLNSDLVMREPSLSEDVATRIRAMHELAEKMRSKLENPCLDAPGVLTQWPGNPPHEVGLGTD